jgi:hypothetical protein
MLESQSPRAHNPRSRRLKTTLQNFHVTRARPAAHAVDLQLERLCREIPVMEIQDAKFLL